MWKCKYCYQAFDYLTTPAKANHSRWCTQNPKSKIWNKGQGTISKYGFLREFEVQCQSCRVSFVVKEREKIFPSKDRYFCSRSCANSCGGKAKVAKYGYSDYKSIADLYYKRQCIVCGITDILEVHHIDEDRSNNHPSNLVFLCPNDHFRLHRNKDQRVIDAIKGHGTAWGGHFVCTEENSGVQIPDAPLDYFLENK